MAEVGTLPRGLPSEMWSRSLRQETALQDQYRRAIHYGDGGVANVGFDRWNAACCLQEQVDSARGVEHARRLVKSRAIAERFTRRSVMKDIQGTELQNTFARANSTSAGLCSEDGSLTRSQALERFGIDLGRVGVMTSARTVSRHSLIDGGSGSEKGTTRGGDGERVAIAPNSSSDVVGIGRGKAEQRANRSDTKRGRGASSDMTTVNNNSSSKGIAARRQGVMSEKLKALDKLLSDEFLCQMPADDEREKEGKTTKASVQSKEECSTGVAERNGTGNSAFVDIFVDLSYGGDDKGGESCLDVSPAGQAPLGTTLAEKIDCGGGDSQALVPEPKGTTTTVPDIHAPGDSERGGTADTRDAALQEKAIVRKMERHHLYKEALPHHRPCLWWASLLPQDMEGVCIPDMVFSAPTGTVMNEGVSLNHNHDQQRKTSPSPSAGSSTDTATKAPAGSTTNRPSTKSSSQQSLLWAFSKPANHEDGGGGDATSTHADPANPCLGVTSLVEGEGCRGGPAQAYPSTKENTRVGKLDLSNTNSSPVQHPLVQQCVYTKVIDGKEGLLCATRAICESGRRGGGGSAGSEGGSSTLKLPLALLKIWGRENDEERGRNNLPGKLGTPCGGRRLRVVSLWTQTEVLGALRDMAKGRWVRRGEKSEKKSGLFGGDPDACCVQAFTKSARYSGASVGIRNTRIVGGGNQSRRERRTPSEDNGLSGPVFYRAAWRRTGEKLFVWKITSRYPYVSSLSAHYCPLVRVGSATPFTANQAEEEAVATAKVKTENLAKVLRRAYDPTLQRLWADWAVNESDGRWLLVEVHGIKNDADVHNAAAARAAPSALAEVESKVYRSKHRIPPKHFCGDPNDLQARIAAANPTQEISLAENAKRAAAASSKHQPSRPPTPSKVAASTKKTLLAQRGAVSEQERRRRKCSGARQMRNQYWRCAGDFCETYSVGQCQKSPPRGKVNRNNPATISAVERQPVEGVRINKSSGIRRGTGVADEESSGGGAGSGDGREYEVEDIIGRRKHALAVEIPRTVLFRLVLNARAALLGWRPSAFDFSQMEKPVQLCSACFTVCNTLERERIETTRRAMDAADQAAKEGKARRNRRPAGWKSRVQHELEESLDADRHVVSRLIDSFETTHAASAEVKKRAPPTSAPRISICKNHARPRPKGSEVGAHGGVAVTWADRCPLAEVRLDGGKDRADASVQSTPRGKTSVPVAGQTTMVTSTRRTTTAPLAPTSGLKRLSPSQAKLTETSSFVGAGAKVKPEEEGRKREIRARRKAKDRVRRRLRKLTTDDAGAGNEKGEPPGKKKNNTEVSGGNAGGTENTVHQKRDRRHELPTILRPTAPTPLSNKVAPDDVLTSDAYLMETSGHHQPGYPHQRANSTTDNKLGEEEDVRGRHAGGESSSNGAISDYGDDDFMDDTRPQLLRPIASREKWVVKEGIAPEWQGDSEGIGCVPVGREGPNSDYGDEEFEDDVT